MVTKTPEEIGWECAAKVGGGIDGGCIMEIIAAAIREDRAAPVSAEEVDAALAVIERGGRIRDALEAARKARAG